MKTILKLAGGILVFFIAFSACKKDNETETLTENPECSYFSSYYLQAKIAGVNWCADDSLYGKLTGTLDVIGVSGDSVVINMSLNDLTPGTFSITPTRNIFDLYTGGNHFLPSAGNNGTLTILTHDVNTNKITGTYAVTLSNAGAGNKKIENGKFSIIYYE